MTDARDPAEVTTIRCPASGCQESWLSNTSSDALPQAVKSHGYQTPLQMPCLRLSRVMAIKHLFRCPASGCQESWLSNTSSDVLPQAVKSHGYQTPLQMSCLRLSRVMAIKHLFRCPASGCQESWLSNTSSDVLPQAVKSHGYQTPLHVLPQAVKSHGYQTPLQMPCLRLSRVMAIKHLFRCSAQAPRHPREDCSSDYSPCNSAHGHRGQSWKSQAATHLCVRNQRRMDILQAEMIKI